MMPGLYYSDRNKKKRNHVLQAMLRTDVYIVIHDVCWYFSYL